MATLGEWRGGVTSLLPSTTWAAPNGLFSGTATRNDGSAYGFASSTSTLTLPSSGLADGYLIVAAFEFEDTSNGRHNPQGRFAQTGGTGNFVSGASSGYNRDNSEDRSYVRTWAFIDNPSAGATIQFQWHRDSDVPTGGTVRSQFQVIPLFYANHGVYSSASTACLGGTSPNQLTGWSVVDESDTAAIELAANVVTVKGDNKRYLCLGGQYWEGLGNTRSQRWHGFRVDGAKDDTAKGYSYVRNSANADLGEMFTTIVETATADRTIDQFVYRGDALGSFPETGADVDAATSASNPNHSMVVLELNDSAEVFRSQSDTQQDIDVAGARVDLQIGDTVNFNDAASFTGSGTTGINAEQAMDVLLGANVSGGYASTSTARYTGYAEFTKDGTGETYSFAGDYGRGNQGTIDTWGWSANLMGFVAASSGEDLGVDAGKITGGEGGTVDALAGWVGFWGVNLDTLEDSGPAAQDVGGGNLVDADTENGGTAAPGPVAVGGAGTVDGDAFGGGSVSLNVGNAALSDLDAFFGGRASLNVSASILLDGDAFGGGLVQTGAVSVSGTTFTDPDAFFAGSVTQSGGPQAVSGGALTDADAFGGGNASPQAVGLSGGALADPDSFAGGLAAPQAIAVSGGAYSDADSFEGGSVAVGATGTAGGGLIDGDTLSGGQANAGALLVSGGGHVDVDGLSGGTVATGSVTVQGGNLVDPDVLSGGLALVGSSLAGGGLTDPDVLSGGAATSGQITVAGGGLLDADTLSGGLGAAGALAAGGGALSDQDFMSGGVAVADGAVTGGGFNDSDQMSGGQVALGPLQVGAVTFVDPDALSGGAITALFVGGGAVDDADAMFGGAAQVGSVSVVGGDILSLGSFGGGLALPANFVWVPSRDPLKGRQTVSAARSITLRESLPARVPLKGR